MENVQQEILTQALASNFTENKQKSVPFDFLPSENARSGRICSKITNFSIHPLWTVPLNFKSLDKTNNRFNKIFKNFMQRQTFQTRIRRTRKILSTSYYNFLSKNKNQICIQAICSLEIYFQPLYNELSEVTSSVYSIKFDTFLLCSKENEISVHLMQSVGMEERKALAKWFQIEVCIREIRENCVKQMRFERIGRGVLVDCCVGAGKVDFNLEMSGEKRAQISS